MPNRYNWTLYQDGAPLHMATNAIKTLHRENVTFMKSHTLPPNSLVLNLQ